ncbi:MAG: DNA-binding transcriptional regulator [Thermoguttaceae bacterium]|nr:DNA-binding transcriptional regulator [Thermoguttaceae bacterium]
MPPDTHRQVLALIETSTEFGRGLLKGILNYTQTIAAKKQKPWRVRLDQRGVHDGLPNDFDSWHGDGIISQSNTIDIFRQLQKKKIPIVELLNNEVTSNIGVNFNYEKTTQIAASHFCDRGLENVAWFGSSNIWWISQLRESFIQELRKLGRKCILCPDDFSQDDQTYHPKWDDFQRKPLIRWLKKLPLPVGIWAVSDMLALRIIETCYDIGLDVPNQVAVLGTGNDSLLCNLSFPQLSSIDVNSERMGFVAAELLDKKMNNLAFNAEADVDKQTIHRAHSPKGVIARQSTDMVATNDPFCFKAIRYIREHFKEKISAVDVANFVELSRAMLDRRFLASFGRTINKVINRMRMETAEYLLLQTDQKIAQVAANSGFNCYEYFFRAFQQCHNMTPEEFRATR